MSERALVAVSAEHRPLTKDEVVAQKNLIQRVQLAVMRKDVHYGIIPGCKKPSLYKAGSEALLATFRIAAIPEVQDLSTGDCYRYRVVVRGVLPDGTVVGAGVGECSTDEEKYRWRAAVCPEEYEATSEDRRRVKFASKWNDRTKKKEMTQVQQVRTEPADLANTALKMAKKRAQIDMTLTATAASDVFDQDIEDLPVEYVEEKIVSAAIVEIERITDEQAIALEAMAEEVGADVAKFCAFLKVRNLYELPATDYRAAVEALEKKRRA